MLYFPFGGKIRKKIIKYMQKIAYIFYNLLLITLKTI